ncbi:hypothetical protein C8F04DRAFT_1187089 [Mycena alexandri]|uniref:Uncharacterized protein n=1 Tax=Mycena alexandri TaxID=1745969 RepID=A0AAD6X2U0_9AGAR|nr:hypothetical protein C8F04DRAFT_1187089 [Mycena alexandri]
MPTPEPIYGLPKGFLGAVDGTTGQFFPPPAAGPWEVPWPALLPWAVVPPISHGVLQGSLKWCKLQNIYSKVQFNLDLLSSFPRFKCLPDGRCTGHDGYTVTLNVPLRKAAAIRAGHEPPELPQSSEPWNLERQFWRDCLRGMGCLFFTE